MFQEHWKYEFRSISRTLKSPGWPNGSMGDGCNKNSSKGLIHLPNIRKMIIKNHKNLIIKSKSIDITG